MRFSRPWPLCVRLLTSCLLSPAVPQAVRPLAPKVRVLSDVSLQRFLLFLSLPLSALFFSALGMHLSDVVVWRVEAWPEEKGATRLGCPETTTGDVPTAQHNRLNNKRGLRRNFSEKPLCCVVGWKWLRFWTAPGLESARAAMGAPRGRADGLGVVLGGGNGLDFHRFKACTRQPRTQKKPRA